MSEGDRYRIRALDRALAILRVLNQYNGLNASELSRIVRLPRPTVVRFLTTLTDCGYVARSDSDERYRVTPDVRNLTYGYREEKWLSSVVNPFLEGLHQELVWPLAFLSLSGDRLVIEALTDRMSSMIERRESPGAEMPLLSSASGYLLIGLSDDETRERLTETALRTETAVMARYGFSEECVREKIEEARQNQCMVLNIQAHTAVAAPVWVNGSVVGAVVIRIKSVKPGEDQKLAHYKDVLATAVGRVGRMIEASLNDGAGYVRQQADHGRQAASYQ